MSLTATIKSIQNEMRKDEGVGGDDQRIEQLAWMLFLKIYDAKEAEWEFTDPTYKSPIPKKLKWRNWAADPEGITGETLLDFVNNELFTGLQNLTLGKNDGRARIVREVFDGGYNYMRSGQQLRKIINKLEDIDFNSLKERQHFGDIYEKILSDLQSAGNSGEFYTPRAVTQFMADRIDPKPGEILIDPACGTGGFLTCAINHMRKHHVKGVKQERLLQSSLRGVEKKHMPHLLCMTNLLLHDIEDPGFVRHDNTLARPYTSWTKDERVDIVLTNPPFGGKETDGIESNFPKAYQTRETADLFLALILRLLKPGGRCAIVLPDGTLFGEGVKTRLKEALLTECNLHTIVRLPNGVFAPYTGIKTNLLFFTKGQPTKEIWYYEHPYPPGVKSYNKTKPMTFEEFGPEREWWENRVENEQAWRVSIDEIKAGNYNLDLKNPHNANTGPGDVDHLLPAYEKLLAQIADTRAQLKKELQQALTAKAGV
jgi:type I restriction enzyme M protein